MKNIVLKIQEGELFRFFDSEERESFTLGAKRTADVAIKNAALQPVQLRFEYSGGAWYVCDLAEEGCRSRALMNGRPFRKPRVKMDGTLLLEKESGEEIARITAVRRFSRKKTGSAYDLSLKTVTTVGSGEGCDIRAASPQVSEKHFFIVFDGENCFIEDAHSLRGTYVNNRKVKRAKLSDYDRISIPGAAYVFYRNRLLFSKAAGGIQIDAVGVSKKVPDRAARGKISLVTDVSFRIGAIFLDEPTSGLSPDLDLEMMELLKDLSKKGRTIVVVTHAMENLDKCDRVAFLGRGGRLCGYGAAKDAFRWFNKRSYSRIFAMLAEEEASEAFAKKYRCSAQYRETYAAFCAEYGAGCMLPPEEEKKAAAWEKPPKELPAAKRAEVRDEEV